MRARLLVALALAGTFWGGWFLRAHVDKKEATRTSSRDEGSTEQTARAFAAVAGGLAACPPRASLDPEERKILVDEIMTAVRSAAAGGPVAQQAAVAEDQPKPAAATVRTADAASARQEADDLIGRAVAAATWTDTDREAYRRLRIRMMEPDLGDVMRTLSRDLNEGRLKVQTSGPPF